MAPNIKDNLHNSIIPQEEIKEKIFYRSPKHSVLEIAWRNIILFFYLHVAALIGLQRMITEAMWVTVIYGLLLAGFSVIVGITAGAHRLWAHKTFKGRFPMRFFAMLMNCVALQNDIYEWARDHRAHHKFSETEADPHNANRGFFFSHMGWLLVRKQPEVISLGGKVDMSDVAADPVVQFQRQNYVPLLFFMNILTSFVIPHYGFGETFLNSMYVCFFFRYCFSLHVTWLVNSVAHIWGARPYDKGISPSEHTLVVVLANGEGWHNYHHAFPYDYKSNEFGFKINMTTFWIDLMAWLGLVYDRRTVPIDVVKKKIVRTGDGTSYQFKEVNDF